MKKQLTEEINKFKKLSGILIKESGGEKALADILIAKLVKSGEKALPKEIGTFTTKAGSKAVLNADAYRNLLTKATLTSEEKNTLHTINKNIVREIGSDVFISAIKEVTKGMGRLEAITLENKIINEFFDDATGDTIRRSLNVGQLKTDEPEVNTPRPQTLRVNTEPPAGMDDIISVGQKSEIRKEMDDFVKGNLDYATISQVSKEDITKMSQIQKLRENETGLKVLEEKAKAEKDLIETEKKLKELTLREKELDIKLKQEKGNVEVQKEKADLRRIKAETTKARLDILWKLKWWIIGGVVLVFGYRAAWPYIKNVIIGKSVFGGTGSSAPTNSNNTGKGRFN